MEKKYLLVLFVVAIALSLALVACDSAPTPVPTLLAVTLPHSETNVYPVWQGQEVWIADLYYKKLTATIQGLPSAPGTNNELCWLVKLVFRKPFTDGHAVPASGLLQNICITQDEVKAAGKEPNTIHILGSYWTQKSKRGAFYNFQGIRLAYYSRQMGDTIPDPTFRPELEPPETNLNNWYVGDCIIHSYENESWKDYKCDPTWSKGSIVFSTGPGSQMMNLGHYHVIANDQGKVWYIPESWNNSDDIIFDSGPTPAITIAPTPTRPTLPTTAPKP